MLHVVIFAVIDHILHKVCTAAFVLSFVSLTNPAISLNLCQDQSANVLLRPTHKKLIDVLRNIGITHTLVQKALTRRHDCALRSGQISLVSIGILLI